MSEQWHDFIRAAAEEAAADEPRHHGNGAARYRFPLQRFGQITLDRRVRYIVRGLIPRDALIIVWGPPKCGKSYFVSDLALHVALEWDYRGRCVEAGAVVYVAAEGQGGLPARIEAFRQCKLADQPDADPPFYLLPTRLDLVADIDQLIADIRLQLAGAACVLIVLDTLNRTLAGSESKDEDMSAYVRACDRIREAFKCAVLVVHHCGVTGERPRGHTSLTGAADAQIAVKRDTSSNIVAIVEHMKDGEEGDQITSRLEVVDVGIDENGEIITSCIVEPVERPSEIKTKGPKLTAAQRRALDLLKDAIARGGEVPPADNHIPSNTPCVTETLWRETCYLGSISDGKQNAKRMAFNRAAETLVAIGAVGKWGTFVWPA